MIPVPSTSIQETYTPWTTVQETRLGICIGPELNQTTLVYSIFISRLWSSNVSYCDTRSTISQQLSCYLYQVQPSRLQYKLVYKLPPDINNTCAIFYTEFWGRPYLSSNGDLNIHTRLDVDRGDLLDNLSGGVEIDESLVDSHLKVIPGLGTLTVRGLSGGDVKNLGGESDRALDANVGVLSSRDDVGRDCVSFLVEERFCRMLGELVPVT